MLSDRCKPTRVRYGHDLGFDGAWWFVEYQYDGERDKWARLSIPFWTKAEALTAEIILRGEGMSEGAINWLTWPPESRILCYN